MGDLALGGRLRPLSMQVLIGLACALVATLTMRRVGVEATFLLVAFGVVVLVGVLNTTALAVGIVMLSPLPSLEALLGLSLPIGIEPLNVLVVMALGAAFLMPGLRVRSLSVTPVAVVLALNVVLYAVAWYRTYGQASIDGSSIALLVKPAFVLLAGFAAVRIIPREHLKPTVALGMAALLAITYVTVVAHRLGLYTTAFQVEQAGRLEFKQYGGIMLDNNTAGVFIAIFAVPTYVLLRQIGRPGLSTLTLALAVPVLLSTLARGAMIAFVCTLVALAIVDRQRIRGILIAAGVLLLGAAWAVTGGRAQTDFIFGNLERNTTANARLSGRESIWEGAFNYLAEDPSRWFVGGGLDDFRKYLITTTLGQDLPAHNVVLTCIVTGGVILAAAYLLVMAVLFVGRGMDRDVRIALRLALVGFFVCGLSADITIFTPMAAWLTLLAAVAYVLASAAERTPETKRSAMPGTPHGLNRARTSSRRPGDAPSQA